MINTQNIESGNTLLAKFLGLSLKHCSDGFATWWEWQDAEKKCFKKHDTPPAFHEDWNLLMMVVEKIEETHECHIIGKGCCIFFQHTKTIGEQEEKKVESVWRACAEFAKWFNEKKTK